MPDRFALIVLALIGWVVEDKPAEADREKVVSALKTASKRAVVTVDEKIEECSGAGGTHVLLASGKDLVHFGGHGVHLQNAPNKGDLLVVGYEPEPRSIENKKFCVPARTVVGRVTAALSVRDREEGDRVLADLAK